VAILKVESEEQNRFVYPYTNIYIYIDMYIDLIDRLGITDAEIYLDTDHKNMDFEENQEVYGLSLMQRYTHTPTHACT